jgi:hypothetical protein
MTNITKESFEELINFMNTWKPQKTYTLFFSRELRDYEKELIEKEGLKYQIISNGLSPQLDINPDTVYIVPDIEKPIKIAYQKERYI